jgi:hypothetical protein
MVTIHQGLKEYLIKEEKPSANETYTSCSSSSSRAAATITYGIACNVCNHGIYSRDRSLAV